MEQTLAQYLPHGYCLSWQPRLMLMHVGSDALTALSYATIPVSLGLLVHRRKDLQFGWVFLLFGVFILACGATHVMSIWTLWHPDYALAGWIKVLTAAASVATAAVLVPLVPKAVALPGPAQWEAVHADLQAQIAERSRIEQEVRRLNDELEIRVQARTAELEQANHRLEALHADLEERVRERTRELEQAQAALVDSARLAGMAEVATNVLHNVGNVLNSVNIAAGVIGQQVRGSRLPGLGKAVQMLRGSDDLVHLLTADARGRQLPEYLERLHGQLQQEQTQLLDELGQMGKSIDHLKDIVATQQAYATPGAQARQRVAIAPAELVDDALRMQAGALTRHHIDVRREIAELPPVPVDRHRVLQILVNLISNAKQAMEADGAQGRQLTIRVWAEPAEGQLKLSVSDEGDGIAAEDLERIFAHGYTTRARGHGFGLHSCILAAHEMGGRLMAESAGPGHGACFTLSLPLETSA
ncbi:sensor histidine kinase [Pseudaquabacterium rugosum]|uniref:histidine kinase n=1 Tax=Pseudaquabacterium rugosum TaxID=2984194 RepID=A0ABU9BJN5_9BURK